MKPAAELVRQKLLSMDEELKFLRYFYNQISGYLGPADDDIYEQIINKYEGDLPRKYETGD